MEDKDSAQAQMLSLAYLPPDGSRWRHYKGSTYKVVCTSLDEGSLIPLVTYRSERNGTRWTRPLDVFLEIMPSLGVPRFTRMMSKKTSPRK